ncbi:conserved hypothetical protein [Thiomonas sp. X19]|uniref:c-type cytochrome n=1 Tax=Thiomonas sp. X19 TaxID=1050370 RepID=UPI000B658EB9|nr:c-type cytochrome [Thiomonas sp. X19]SCC94504.1 conserved hypothetical protein [Thiomonas sp. X19]
METTYTKDPGFWRAGAISATSVMLVILAFLSVNSLADISAGGGHVPLYTVINHKISYQYDPSVDHDVPVIGKEQLLFGKRYDEVQAKALLRQGKLVIQSRACIDCHTFLGNGAYYGPDLTKAWLDPAWEAQWMPMTQSSTKQEAMVKFLMHPELYPTWSRQMPNLQISQSGAEAVVAYLKWLSAINTNGFPANFGHEPQQ